MADRIVLLDRGVVQQVGPPREIYERPRNRFVAGFIGSPEINLVEGALRAGEGGAARFEDLVLPADRAGIPRPGPYTLGIRPEGFAVSLEARPGTAPLRVCAAEDTGSRASHSAAPIWACSRLSCRPSRRSRRRPWPMPSFTSGSPSAPGISSTPPANACTMAEPGERTAPHAPAVPAALRCLVIEAPVGGATLRIRDTVEVIGPNPAPILALYHANLGYPVVRAGMTVELNGERLETLAADPEVAPAAPTLHSASAGWNTCRIASAGAPAVEMRWNGATLPFLQLWRDLRPGCGVFSVEPCNAERFSDGSNDAPPHLSAGASRTLELQWKLSGSGEAAPHVRR